MFNFGKSFHKEYIEAMKQLAETSENVSKEKSCSLHNFEPVIKHNRVERWKCVNCGCVEDNNFAEAYYRGLEHGREINESRQNQSNYN